MTTSPKFVIVIGTSAGGLRALQLLLPQLNTALNAAILIVMHLSREGTAEGIFKKLQLSSVLPLRLAINGEPLEKNVIYLAPPDHHLLVDTDNIVTGKGAPENNWRPSINNLFRSAAATYNSCVIGIMLTGLRDDGTAGMCAIKKAGGVAIIQDPVEAEYPDMPLSVEKNVDVDHISTLANMGRLLFDLCQRAVPDPVDVSSDVKLEAALDLRVSTRVDDLAHLEKIDISCPDCGGGLHIIHSEQPRHYRCHVGHSFSEKQLIIRMSEVMENTLWIALRMMEEKRFLLMQLMRNDRRSLYPDSGMSTFADRATELETHIENLKLLIFTATKVNE